MEPIIPDSTPPPLSLFLLTFLMKEKAATTFLKDAHGHTQRSARNKMCTKTQTRPINREREKEGEKGPLF